MCGNELTKARQQKVVGEGLAVGLLALGVAGVTSRKQAVEFAFGRAWRGWAERSRFGQVHGEIQRNDVTGILHDSAGRQGAVIADWACGRFYEPQLRVPWSIEEAGESLAEESGVPFARWVELAEVFLADFEPDEVRRTT